MKENAILHSEVAALQEYLHPNCIGMLTSAPLLTGEPQVSVEFMTSSSVSSKTVQTFTDSSPSMWSDQNVNEQNETEPNDAEFCELDPVFNDPTILVNLWPNL